MFGGGLYRGSSTMIAGTPGGGKTLLGLQFLAAGAQAGEPGVHFGMFEHPQRLLAKAEKVGLPFAAAVAQEQIEISWQWPRVDLLDVYAERLFAAVKRRKARRVFIDGLHGFQHVAAVERLPAFFTAILEELAAQGVTTLYSVQLNQLAGPDVDLPSFELLPVTDNMLFLRYVELRSQLHRLVSIVKVRDSDFDTAIREFSIDAAGINVASTFHSAAAILTGVGHPSPSTPED
jgi:circadian clock protein KaiC